MADQSNSNQDAPSYHNASQKTANESLTEKIRRAGESERKAKEQEDQDRPEEHERERKLSQEEQIAFGDQSAGDEAMNDALVRHTDAQTETEKAKTEIMRWIASETFGFMKWWCCFVGLIVWMYIGTKQGDVEKEVIITLLGTTTVSVVGLVGFIVRGLFGVKDDKSPK
ncbi:hypothetical protein [Salinivibrio kushneri]|uniref:hypothetical protein n=1 Tax=Salinivibrio kushneri TaxID=1908198 RepID=UPI0018E2AD03|nr:hypothetical protein [Salinivibrio kushneri]